MQKKVGTITSFAVTVLTVAVCVLRFFQLLKYTDSETGFVTGGKNLTYSIYALLIGCFAVAAVYAFGKREYKTTLSYGSSKMVLGISYLLPAAFFFDFIHQCYNCFDYIQKTAYVEYNYIIPLAVSGVAALLSSFYFFTFAVTYRGSNYDLKNFTSFHFMPVIWAFFRLIVIMTRIMNVLTGVDDFCEFIFLAFLLSFLFCFISALDKMQEKATGLFVFFAIITAVMSCVVALPRIAMLISGNANVLNKVTYSCTAYIAVGIFAAALVADLKKRMNVDNKL